MIPVHRSNFDRSDVVILSPRGNNCRSHLKTFVLTKIIVGGIDYKSMYEDLKRKSSESLQSLLRENEEMKNACKKKDNTIAVLVEQLGQKAHSDKGSTRSSANNSDNDDSDSAVETKRKRKKLVHHPQIDTTTDDNKKREPVVSTMSNVPSIRSLIFAIFFSLPLMKL
jgi:hypothetical protein